MKWEVEWREREKEGREREREGEMNGGASRN